MDLEFSESTPALDAARKEFTDIATNPENPRHAGYQRGDSEVSAYLDQLYKKAVPANAPVTVDPGITVIGRDESLSLEDTVAHSEIDTMLRRAFGNEYDTEMGNMRLGAQHLFSIDGGDKVLAEFSSLITALGPLAEVRGIRFLAEIGSLIKQQRGTL